MGYTTVTGSLARFERGRLAIIDDDPRHYCFSNVFEVASKAKAWDKIAVAKNLENVIGLLRLFDRATLSLHGDAGQATWSLRLTPAAK